MSGVKPMPKSRGKFVSAGYSGSPKKREKEEKELYIAEYPAGSAQDSLRDLNLPGYHCERPWRETPEPAFEVKAQKPSASVKANKPVRHLPNAPRRPKGFAERFIWEAEHDKKGLCVCICLIVALLTLGAAWGQKMVSGVEKQQAISDYRVNTAAFEKENEKLAQQLEIAMDGERIRNLAQNELGMLRPERAQTEKIYIRMPSKTAEEVVQEDSETRMEPLDFLLGLLSLFHIGE